MTRKVEEAIYTSLNGFSVRANWQGKRLAENFSISRYNSPEEALEAARVFRDECKSLAAEKKAQRRQIIDQFDSSWRFPKPKLPDFKRRKSVSSPLGLRNNK